MDNNAEREKTLKLKSLQVRRNILRMVKASRAGHAGGALSAADIMSALFFDVMKLDPKDPAWPDRDRFVLSAGHKCLALYAVLAEIGYMDPKLMDTYGAISSKLPGHPDMHKVPGIESNTGALGHGLALAGGMAMGLKMQGKDSRVFVVMGDGELAEGSNWEAAAAAGHHRLDNMLVFADCNGLQISGPTREVMDYEPLAEKWRAFGWSVREIDGHNYQEILKCAAEAPFEPGKPSAVIARTVKSKGFTFAENKVEYHYWTPNDEQLQLAEDDLDEAERSIRNE